MARAIRGIRVGAPYRIAEGIVWPAMVSLTRREWQGAEHLGRHGQGMVVAVNHISWFDPLVVLLVKLVIGLGELKSRDPREDPHRAVRPDQEIQSKLKNWRAILDWPPQRRVGWFVGIVLGIAAGGAFLWYMLRE